MQLLNAALGGTLDQHIEGHRFADGDHSAPVHDVVIRAGTRLAAIVGSWRAPVNSRHHQGVAALAPELQVAAQCPGGGLIEALEHPHRRFVVAVQWHPEDQVHTDPRQRRLFEAFARAVRVTAT
jgi:putative glutamine amidotransferase